MKKTIGLVVIGICIAAILYVIFQFVTKEPPMKSPLPKDNGVNVIFITPAKDK